MKASVAMAVAKQAKWHPQVLFQFFHVSPTEVQKIYSDQVKRVSNTSDMLIGTMRHLLSPWFAHFFSPPNTLAWHFTAQK